jgi:hypothetical protein
MTAFTLPAAPNAALVPTHPSGAARRAQAAAVGTAAQGATPGWVLPVAILLAPLVLLGAVLLPLLSEDDPAWPQPVTGDPEAGAS